MTQVSVTVDDKHLGSIDDVADALRSRGMEVEQVLSAVGIITGSVPERARLSLDDVDGVSAVVEEQHVQLPPPDAPVQ